MIKNLLLLLLLCSCAKAPDGWKWGISSRPLFMRMHKEQRYGADDDWTKGFNDGCKSAMADSRGVHMLIAPEVDGWKMTGRNPKDPSKPHPEVKSAKTYSRAWFDGFEECTYQYDWWVL